MLSINEFYWLKQIKPSLKIPLPHRLTYFNALCKNEKAKWLFGAILLLSSTFMTLAATSAAARLQNDTFAAQDSVQATFETRISATDANSPEKLEAYLEYSEFLQQSGDSEASVIQLQNALHIAQNTNNNERIASVGNLLANTYAAMGNFKASNATYLLALNAAEASENSGDIAKISMNLAANFNFTGDYEKAAKYGLYSLKIKETDHNLERICYHYIAMGNIFRENNNTTKWEQYVRKAYKMKDVEGCASFSDKAKIYNSLGGLAVQKEEFKQALLYYDTLMMISTEVHYEQGISTALTNSAGVYKQLDNFPKALELATKAEQYFDENPYETIFNRNFKAELYNLTGEYGKGLALARQNINTDELSYYSTENLKCLELLYQLNFNLSNYDEAFFWNDSLRTTEQLLRDEDIRNSFEELEARYETEKKEQQIELLTAENELKNQRINVGIGIVVVLAIVILLVVYILNIRKKQAELLQNDLQQQVLRAQMNPHFIFNVLGSIQNYMLKNDLRKASDFLAQFASLTRATLNNSAAETISLADEISMLRNYIELEKMRSQNKFDFRMDYDQNLELDFIKIPPMLIQPFIENAIKHGFKKIGSGGFLKIQITDKTDCVEFLIEDNGSGIQEPDDAEKKHRSMAMAIFEKRRKLITQKYKKYFAFEMQNLCDVNPDKTGVRVRIEVPVIEY